MCRALSELGVLVELLSSTCSGLMISLAKHDPDGRCGMRFFLQRLRSRYRRSSRKSRLGSSCHRELVAHVRAFA